MGNPLFQGGQMPQQGGGPQNIAQQLQQFAGRIQGDPRQIVQQMLASGKMTQQQLDGLLQQARQIAAMIQR